MSNWMEELRPLPVDRRQKHLTESHPLDIKVSIDAYYCR